MARMRQLEGKLFLICPMSKWKEKFTTDCILYTLARAGTYGSYRVVWLHVPKNIYDVEWEKLRLHHPLTHYGHGGWRVQNGYVSLRTIRGTTQQQAIIDDFREGVYKHMQLGSLPTILATLADKGSK